jgi:hypothetical protein
MGELFAASTTLLSDLSLNRVELPNHGEYLRYFLGLNRFGHRQYTADYATNRGHE